MTEVREITSESEFSSLESSLPSSTLLVTYFHAPWAAPCKQMSAVLEALASTYPVTTPPTVAFVSLNAEELSDVSEEHNVTAVPFVVLKRGGQVLEEVSGSNAAKVREAVERYAAAVNRSAAVNGGANQLPPEQVVTRPAEEREPAPLPATQAPATSAAAAASTSSTGPAKNLSAYVPPPQEPAPPAEPVDKEALFARLAQLVKAADVMLFMKGTPSSPQCGFSRKLVGLLRDRSIRYGFFNILADDDVRQGLKEYSEWPTFPQLYVEGELVGGLDIVQESFDEDPDFLMNFSVKKNETAVAS